MKKMLELKINQKLEISFAGEENWQSTSIQGIKGNIILVAVPTVQRRPLIPQPEEQISVRLIAGNAVLQFNATFLGVKTEDRVPLLMLNKPLTYLRIQRRKYYRHPVVLDIKIAVAEDEGLNQKISAPQDAAAEWIGVKTLDIGGGGIRLAFPVKLVKGKKLALKICIDPPEDKNIEIILVAGQVVREEITLPDRNSYIYGVSYIDIKEVQRERIINYIFNLTRKRTF